MAEIKRTYYSNGELEEEWFEINGIMEGEHKQYYDYDDLKFVSISNYVNGEEKSFRT